MAKRHNKYCTFKRSDVCICANIEAALEEQAIKHKDELNKSRLYYHEQAIQVYRSGVIRAFTELIDNELIARGDITSSCSCTNDRWY